MTNTAASIVVCVHRHQPELLEVLAAVDEQAPPDAEVVLVRSETPEGTPLPTALSSLLASTARPVRTLCESRPGVALARARGMAAAESDVVLYLDEDAVPRDGWYEALSGVMTAAGIAAAGGTVLPAWPGGRPPGWLPGGVSSYYGMRRAGTAAAMLQRPFGANMAIRRSAALGVGGFRVDLGHTGRTPGYGEETELCERLTRAGHAVAEVPRAIVDHRVSAEQLRLRWLVRRAWYDGRYEAIRLSGSSALVRLAKLGALLLALPGALLGRRAAVYLTVRIAVNLGYLRQRSPRSSSPGTGVDWNRRRERHSRSR